MVIEEDHRRFFLGYALSAGCIEDNEKDSRFRKKYLEGGTVSEGEIKETYPTAIERMNSRGLEFNLEDVKRYWWVVHNEIVPDYCQVKFGEVEKIGDRVELRHKDGTERKAINVYGLNLRKGSYVTYHKGQIVHEITEKEFKEYG